ncbi:MAG: RNA polymerase factor sigma-54 [Saprospiraceae bacterium]|jgi:RNA polymerase sigma-54 factor|nr:RNA polymerase factor sigma-54 [Saprospiraceae bacterium]MBK6478911.1 RNA polymerase factor sigma-54 [Saprospiraceae bacterium]MBK6815653.1 RNA polymerase factor sigma-54 [Saprospiraceae bacterium]MBK7372631.1 RNA polymerase factor sigma-54 [Saprospiraceae bacterium]MBK7439325.1 RNA polymerase factor sigma-54 [Saprospiraceae bacterium]
MLKQSISQKMLQKLSPQQIQLMKLLQIPSVNLDQRIKEELEVNPALEEGDDESADVFDLAGEGEEKATDEQNEKDEILDEYIMDYLEDDPSTYKTSTGQTPTPEQEKQTPMPVERTFHEYLMNQLSLLNLNEREYKIAVHIIGSIDDDGYLRRDPLAIIDDLMFTQNIDATRKEILGILKSVQQFDPPGIGARDLQECLIIQLKVKAVKPGNSPDQKKKIEAGLAVLTTYFEEFTKKHFHKLERGLNLQGDDLKDVMDEILKLNPKPASAFNESSAQSVQYIIPDFIILNSDGFLELTLNSRNAPDLHISEQYKNLLNSYKESYKTNKTSRQAKEAVLFIKQKIDSAKWFIDAIRQRQETMFRTMYAIMQYQQEFFKTGDERKLKPMILKDIAEISGYDISTISRVANSKFVQTEYGTKRLKEFFSESLQTQEGEEVSTLEVKKIISDMVGGESKKKPLSDEKIKTTLERKGYNIARRTIAKYREQLNIPVARLRKEL